MPTAAELLEQGNHAEAINRVRQDLAQNPADAESRMLLFQLLVEAEDLDGARSELTRIVATTPPSYAEALSPWEGLLAAARIRLTFTATGEGQVVVLPALKVPTYMQQFGDASAHLRAGEFEKAAALLEAGWRDVPQVSGSVDGERFVDLRDSDDILGPFLEVLLPSPAAYVWVPWEQIQQIEILVPAAIWIPARLVTKGGPEGQVFIPPLYSGTGGRDDTLRLGRGTVWETRGSIRRGYGQRDLAYETANGASGPVPFVSSRGTTMTVKGIREISTITFD